MLLFPMFILIKFIRYSEVGNCKGSLKYYFKIDFKGLIIQHKCFKNELCVLHIFITIQ